LFDPLPLRQAEAHLVVDPPPSTPRFEADLHHYLRSVSMHRSLQAPESTCAKPSDVRAIYVVSQPNPQGITVDGHIDDWILPESGYDFVTDMTNGGQAGQPVKGKLYLRWNCATRTLCALVKTIPGICLDGTGQFFMDEDISGEVPVLDPGIRNVMDDNGKIVGWEGT
jgi:hypothetical protein